MREARLKYITGFQYGDALPKEDGQDGKFKVFGSNGSYSTFWKTNTKAPAIIIGRKGSYGKVNWTNEVCYASDTTFFIDERSTKHNLRWLYYGLQTLDLDVGSNETAVPGLSRDDAYEKTLYLPPLAEQQAIAEMLDRETARLDELITEKERLVELLQEKRRALTTNAVTRGLDLDAPTVDSGIEWLGEIPKHWQAKKIKYASTIFRGKFTHRPRNDEKLYDGQHPFIQTGEIAQAAKYVTEFTQTLNEEGYKVTTEFPAGTLLMTIAANIADVAILGFNACFPDSIVGFYPHRFLDNEFLFYQLKSMKDYFISLAVLNTQLNLNIDRINTVSIAIPPLEEQKVIVEYIEAETAKIDCLQAATQETIELLKERRLSLIAAAVTGKISVAEI